MCIFYIENWGVLFNYTSPIFKLVYGFWIGIWVQVWRWYITITIIAVAFAIVASSVAVAIIAVAFAIVSGKY